MNQKKSKKTIVIFIIILVVMILAVGILLAYFTTDIFKGNKELFFKYVNQIGDTEDGFIEDNIKQYYDKKTTNSYTNEGNFTLNATDNEVVNIDNLNILQKIASNVNDIDKMKDVINQYTNRTKFDIVEDIFGTNDITDENIRKYLFKDSSVRIDSSNSSRYIYDLDKLASKTKKYSNDIEKILNKSMQCTNQIKNSVNTSELNMEITTIINRITSAIMHMFNISLKAIQNTYIIISKNNSTLHRI